MKTTTDIDMLLQVHSKFWHNTGFLSISGVLMLFCALLGDWKYAKRASAWCWSFNILKFSQWLQEIYWQWIFLFWFWI